MDKAKEIGGEALVANNEATKIEEPGPEALDRPATTIAAKGAAILSRTFASEAIRRNERDSLLSEPGIYRIAIVGFVADETFGFGNAGAPLNQVVNEGDFVRRCAGNLDGNREAGRVGDGHELGPFAALGFAHAEPPLFGWGERAVDEAFVQVDIAQGLSVANQSPVDASHSIVANSLLEATMAGLVRRILSGQVVPGSTRAQNP